MSHDVEADGGDIVALPTSLETAEVATERAALVLVIDSEEEANTFGTCAGALLV